VLDAKSKRPTHGERRHRYKDYLAPERVAYPVGRSMTTGLGSQRAASQSGWCRRRAGDPPLFYATLVPLEYYKESNARHGFVSPA